VAPPQLSAVTVNGDQATFSYYGDVICESDSSDPNEVSQFTYVTPYTDLTPGDPAYASAVSCPPPGGGTSITVTWPTAIPASSGVRFKYVRSFASRPAGAPGHRRPNTSRAAPRRRSGG
jgi:hypothetical protein